MDEVLMTKVLFQDYLESIEFHLDIEDGRCGHGAYTPEQRLFMTHFFLAHSPTLLYMRSKFAVPQNTNYVCILWPTIAVRKTATVTGPYREVRWPITEEQHLNAMAEFS